MTPEYVHITVSHFKTSDLRVNINSKMIMVTDCTGGGIIKCSSYRNLPGKKE